ncbi:hypothetical protein Tco_1492519 [Tanacetum coccineum]
MKEPDTLKKVKKGAQVQLSMDEELARKMEEEERLNLEAAWELQRQLDERQQVPTEATQSKGIDWNDPSVLIYHALKNKHVSIAQARRNMITYLKNQGGYKESYFKRMSYNDIRPIFERVWDHVNAFIPIGSEVEKGRRASDKQVEDNSKRQKKEKESDDFEQEKEDLRMWLSILKDEEESVTLEFLFVRYPIVNWEYQLYGQMEMKDMEAYNLTRAGGTIRFQGVGKFEDAFEAFREGYRQVLLYCWWLVPISDQLSYWVVLDMQNKRYIIIVRFRTFYYYTSLTEMDYSDLGSPGELPGVYATEDLRLSAEEQPEMRRRRTSLLPNLQLSLYRWLIVPTLYSYYLIYSHFPKHHIHQPPKIRSPPIALLILRFPELFTLGRASSSFSLPYFRGRRHFSDGAARLDVHAIPRDDPYVVAWEDLYKFVDIVRAMGFSMTLAEGYMFAHVLALSTTVVDAECFRGSRDPQRTGHSRMHRGRLVVVPRFWLCVAMLCSMLSIMGYSQTVRAKMAPRGRPTRTTRSRPVTTTPPPVTDPTTTTSVTSAQLQAMIKEGVTAALAARDTTRNGDDSHSSGVGSYQEGMSKIEETNINGGNRDGNARSFVSTTFSSQIVITPTALDHDYNVELADGRIVGLNTIIRGCVREFPEVFTEDLPGNLAEQLQETYGQGLHKSKFLTLGSSCPIRQEKTVLSGCVRLQRIEQIDGKNRSSFSTIEAEAVQCTNPSLLREAKILIAYCDASDKEGFGRCVDAKRKGDFLCITEANVVADALSRKEREPLRVRALVMTIGLDLPKQIMKRHRQKKKRGTSEWRMLEVCLAMAGWLPSGNNIMMDVSHSFLSHRSGYDTHLGIRERLRSLPIFMPMRDRSPLDKWEDVLKEVSHEAWNTCIQLSVIVDPRFSSNFWKSLQKALGSCLAMSLHFIQIDGQCERTIQTLEIA